MDPIAHIEWPSGRAPAYSELLVSLAREAGMTVTTTEETAMNATKHEQDAFNAGRDAALSAASWVIDGNTKREHIARVVELLDDGDDIYPYLPAAPTLSGEWADDPTPLSLAREITGDDDPGADVIDALADAFDRGVADHFVQECERILRAAL